MIVLVGRDDSAFIPPLQLTKADAGNPRDVGAGVGLGFGRHKGVFSGSEHFQNTFNRGCLTDSDCTLNLGRSDFLKVPTPAKSPGRMLRRRAPALRPTKWSRLPKCRGADVGGHDSARGHKNTTASASAPWQSPKHSTPTNYQQNYATSSQASKKEHHSPAAKEPQQRDGRSPRERNIDKRTTTHLKSMHITELVIKNFRGIENMTCFNVAIVLFLPGLLSAILRRSA